MITEQVIQLKETRGRIEATDADLAGSAFVDVRMTEATFDDVNFAGATINDCNMSGWQVKNVNLSNLQISQADLRGAAIKESMLDGMTIDGVPVAELMAAYRAAIRRYENIMATNLIHERQQAHELLDLLPPEQLDAVRSLLKVMVHP